MKKAYCTRWIISLLVAAALAAIPAKADELYARIGGTVMDPSGASVPGRDNSFLGWTGRMS